MSQDILGSVDLALTVIIAVATIWIAVTANRISKQQLRLDHERQKLEWCRQCLQAISKAVSLGAHTSAEISETEFKQRRRQLRGEIIALKNEGELFLVRLEEDPDRVASLAALKRCFDAMNGTRFKLDPSPPTEAGKAARAELLHALKDFRAAMRSEFGSVWSDLNGSR